MSNFINRQKTLGQPQTIQLENGLNLLLENGNPFYTEAELQIMYTNRAKHPVSFINRGQIGYVLNEDGSYALNEDGSRILLQESTGSSPVNWINRTKS